MTKTTEQKTIEELKQGLIDLSFKIAYNNQNFICEDCLDNLRSIKELLFNIMTSDEYFNFTNEIDNILYDF